VTGEAEEGSPDAALDHGEAHQPAAPRRGRLEPTLDDSATEDLPAPPAQPDRGADRGGDPSGWQTLARATAQEPSPAPTLSSSESPQPRRIERRKILSLRLSTLPQQVDGAKLLETLQEEGLEHGKYNVFHRLHDDGASIFSIASMVEPGTFDPETMPEIEYPGVTLFAQLPGPVPGMHALNELVACARRLQQALGGTLQDDRGVPLTVHRIERLRQEIREFERPASAGGRSAVMPRPPN
jgi:cell division protein ZipA